jgi:hypothetical protein
MSFGLGQHLGLQDIKGLRFARLCQTLGRCGLVGRSVAVVKPEILMKSERVEPGLYKRNNMPGFGSKKRDSSAGRAFYPTSPAECNETETRTLEIIAMCSDSKLDSRTNLGESQKTIRSSFWWNGLPGVVSERF